MIELLDKQMIAGEEVLAGTKVSLIAFEENVLVAHGKAIFVEVEKVVKAVAERVIEEVKTIEETITENKKGGKN